MMENWNDPCPACSGQDGRESGGEAGWLPGPCTCHPALIALRASEDDKNDILETLTAAQEDLDDMIEAREVLSAVIDEHVSQRESARAWLTGHLVDDGLGDPVPEVWACMWCGDMIHGGREAAGTHAIQCVKNPAVVKAMQSADLLSKVVGLCQRYQPAGSPPPGGVLQLVSWILESLQRGAKHE